MPTNLYYFKINNTFKLLGLIVLWSLLFMVLGQNRAHATINLNPDPGTSGMPASLRDYLRACDSGVNSPAFVQWISLANNPTATTFTVAYGTTSVQLEYHFAAAVCFSNSAVKDTSNKVETSSPAGVSGIVGTELFLNYNPYNSVGLYRHSSKIFTYAPPGGFTSSSTHTITLGTRGINYFTTGKYLCITDGATATSLTDYTKCATYSATFNVRINTDKVKISGRVYDIRTGSGFSNVSLFFCLSNPTATTDSSGNYSVLIVNGGGYCVRVASGSGPTSVIAGPNVRPWSENYPGVTPSCPGFTSSTTTPLVNGKSYCTQTSYECQVAGGKVTPDACGGNIDRSTDGDAGGFDIVYETSPPGFSCSQVNTSPIKPEINNAFSLLAGYVSTGGNAGDIYSGTVTINTTPLLTPSSPYSGIATGSPNTTSYYTKTGLTSSIAQIYTVNWTVAITGTGVVGTVNLSCSGTFSTYTKPYFMVFGGDVSVGGGFSSGNSCTIKNPAYITAFNAGGGTPKGAGVQIASIATGVIDGFASSSKRSVAPKAGFGQSFANQPSGNGFGGSLDSSYITCAHDFYNDVGPSLTDSILGTSATVSPGNRGSVYKKTGNLDINPSAATTISANKSAVFYVDGDVTIKNNITYGSWTGMSNVPFFALIVKGDIYIDPSVTTIYGLLVAQPRADGTKGRIFTCTIDTNGSDAANAAVLNGAPGCSNTKLHIRGAVVARQVKLLRSNGTLSSAVVNEGLASGNISEVILYSSSTWIYAMLYGLGGNNSNIYDSITALPPIL